MTPETAYYIMPFARIAGVVIIVICAIAFNMWSHKYSIESDGQRRERKGNK